MAGEVAAIYAERVDAITAERPDSAAIGRHPGKPVRESSPAAAMNAFFIEPYRADRIDGAVVGYAIKSAALTRSGGQPVDIVRSRAAAESYVRLLNDGGAEIKPHAVLGSRVMPKVSLAS
jgi:hypothetical protein